jgi:hypothetical protein
MEKIRIDLMKTQRTRRKLALIRPVEPVSFSSLCALRVSVRTISVFSFSSLFKASFKDDVYVSMPMDGRKFAVSLRMSGTAHAG